MAEKLFTLQEAEELIPELEQIVQGLLQNKRSAMEIGQELADFQEQMKKGEELKISASDYVNKKTELDFLVKIINEEIDAIEELGAQPKDLDLGLVDFPSILDGEEVLLCWKYGEKGIRFYHSQAEGYSGRKPLP